MFHHSARQRRAFTLIELLTVIAIMAILSSMLFPSFSRAREMARRSSCSSNMRQLGLAFVQYAQDYDERYPFAGNWQKWNRGGHWVSGPEPTDPVSGTGAILSGFDPPYTATGTQADIENGALFSYTKSSQIYRCPSHSDAPKTGLSYSMNCVLGGQAVFSPDSDTDVVLLVDEAYPSDGFFWVSDDDTASDQMTQIHNGGGNLLFADGHVKFYPFGRFPVGDNGVDTAFGAAKVRRSGQPRFQWTDSPACQF